MKTGVLHFAKENHVLIQPVAIVWFPQNKWIRNRVIVNYRSPFSMENLTIDESVKKWNETVLEGINQNNKMIADIVEMANISGNGRIKINIK